MNYSVLANARDGHRRLCAQQCAASGRAAYFIKHMRKAGGSSLRDYLAHHVCTGPWLRRHTFINEGAIFDTSLFNAVLRLGTHARRTVESARKARHKTLLMPKVALTERALILEDSR